MEILEHHRNQMETKPRIDVEFRPIFVNRYTAASLLQKAIRRSETAWALAAAHRLFDLDRRMLWRRLAVILFEDVGIDDVDLALDILACMPRRSLPSLNWTAISNLVVRLSDAPKTQIANHISILGHRDPKEVLEQCVFDLPFTEALEFCFSEKLSLPQKAAVCSALANFKGEGEFASHPEADRTRLISSLSEKTGSIALPVILSEGIRTTNLPLPICAVISLNGAHNEPQERHPSTEEDDFPSSQIVCELPSWAFDQYTRAGLAALRHFHNRCTEWRAWWSERQLSSTEAFEALKFAHFEFESGAMKRRIFREPDYKFHERTRELPFADEPESNSSTYSILSGNWAQFEKVRASQIRAAFRSESV
ncbi:hypothetical protein [Ponticaulis sp.]|uniref:hypothetical protein n=1 Tax=Ponticaulis sp. TaxID=2020902 RepID=UPI000C89739E|nr:hypothetical protein [Ponticaulis sp.]MAI89215.1 hypothetical protein [Ponticaulis sp.]